MRRKNKEEINIEAGASKSTKKKRNRKIWKIALPIVIVLVIVLIVVNSANSGNAALAVYTTTAQRGAIQSTLNTNGTVSAETSTTYFAPASSKIAGVEVEKGDVVKSGDMLICFDQDAVDYAKKQSELEKQISAADYSASVKDYNKQKQKLAQAEADIATYEVMVDNYEQYIDDLTNGITDATALKKSDLYAQIYDVEKAINNYTLAIQTPDENTDVEALMQKQTAKQNELVKLQNELSMLSDYKTDYGWEDLLTQAKKDLSDAQTKLQEAKSDKASAEAGVATENKLASYQLTQEKTALTTDDATRKYEEALNGIVADYDGVVTQLAAVEGATVQEGTQLLVLESYGEVCVQFQASKYDLEKLKLGQQVEATISGEKYQGTVTKIDKMAQPNSSGVPMVGAKVHIDNPDENIYLGIEAKLSIITADLSDALLVPVEAVNVDNTGDFCYVIVNGVLEKKYVTTGVSSESMIEITDGLTEGEEIVTSAYLGMDMEEGMAVTVMPAQ